MASSDKNRQKNDGGNIVSGKGTRGMHKGSTEIGRFETRAITTAFQIFLVFIQKFILWWPVLAVKKKKKKKMPRGIFIISPDTS